MRKIIILSLVVLSLSGALSAQFVNFPAGYNNLPDTPLQGPVHTVLYTRQRGETTFGAAMEVYDERGKLIELSSSLASIEHHSGKLMRMGGKTIYLYDKSGNLYRRNSFNPGGDLTGYSLYKYDEKGRLIEETEFNKDGKYGGYHRYSYSPDKREVEATWQFIYGEKDTGKPMKSVLTYDEKNRWISRHFLGDIDTFEYDKQGNLTKDVHKTWWHSYTYKFDKHGNWIERAVAYSQADGQSNPTYENEYRVITYYPERSVNPK